MNLRWRITLGFTALVLIMAITAGSYARQGQWETLNHEYNRQIEPISREALDILDPVEFARIVAAKEEDSASYRAAAAKLAGVQRRYKLRELYVIGLNKQNQPLLVFDLGPDADPTSLWQTPAGEFTTSMKEALSGTAKADPLRTDAHGRLIKLGYAPIKSGQRVLGVVACSLDVSHIGGMMRRMFNWLLAGGLFVVLIGYIASFLLASHLTEPLLQLVEVLPRIQGGDLTQTLETRRHDEVGKITQAINRLQTDLRRMAGRVNDLAGGLLRQIETIRQFAAGLQRTSETTTAAVNDINLGAQASTDTIKRSLNELVETGSTLQKLNDQVAAMRQAVLDARSQVLEGAGAIESTIDMMQATGAQVAAVREKVDNFNNRTAAVDEIITSIEAIANQTATLALNATIEAARAGEYGRGFAVVARRIQRLATSARESVSQIREHLTEMAKTANLGQHTAVQTEEAVASAAATISGGAGQLKTIVSNLEKITTEFMDLAILSTEASRTSGQARERMRAASESAATATDGIVGINNGCEEMALTVRQLTSLTGSLHEALQALIEDASRFKI